MNGKVMSEPSVWKWLKQTFQKYWRRIVLIVLFAMILAGVGVAFPIVWKMLIDRAIVGVVDKWLALLFVGLFIVRVVPMVELLQERFLHRYKFSTRYELFKHLLRLSMSFHRDKKSTKVVLEADKGVAAGTSLMELLLEGSILADIPVAIFALWYVALYSISAVSVLVVFLIIFFYVSYWLGRKIARIVEEYDELDNEVSTRQGEVLQQIEVVKLRRAEKYEEEWFQEYTGKLMELNNRSTTWGAWFQFMSGLAHVLPFGIALVLFLPSVADGTLTIGTLIALQLFSIRAVAPVGFLGHVYQKIKRNTAKLKPALRLFEEESTVLEADNPVEMKPLRHEIGLRNVTFSYPDTNELVLRGVSFTIAAGEKMAIVGRTGSGKTTLARLIMRLYDPDHGIITMDGTDLRQISADSFYQQVSYVTQEVAVFSGTIGENVRHGLGECRKERIIAALRQASAYDFVLQKKHGLETKVGELGERLSGGEKQRLALTHVFLRRASVVILDEATAALDRMTEREVQESFDRLLAMNGGVTMLVIAHRITTVKNANRIVVLDNGQIVDIGKHKELLDRCELYQELCQGMAE